MAECEVISFISYPQKNNTGTVIRSAIKGGEWIVARVRGWMIEGIIQEDEKGEK